MCKIRAWVRLVCSLKHPYSMYPEHWIHTLDVSCPCITQRGIRVLIHKQMKVLWQSPKNHGIRGVCVYNML